MSGAIRFGALQLPVVRDLAVAYVAKVPPAPQLLALLVAGQLLNPIETLGLALPPPLEEAA